MNWQPIETAPRDGTNILVFYPNGEFEADFNDFEGRFVAVTAVMRWEQWPNGHGDWKGYYTGTTPLDPPSHWMPLPSPPNA